MSEPKEMNAKELESPGVVPPPSNRETLEIEAARTRHGARYRPVRARVQSNSYGSRSFASPHADHAGFRARLADALGTVSGEFTEASMHQLIKAVSHCDAREGGAELELNAALALIQSIRPTNEVEAALALQAAASHRLAMELLARVRRGMTLSSGQVYGALAVKLMRAFVAQVDMLERIRRGAQQVVRVEHVTVAAGAQAVIGSVTHHAERTGGS